MDQVNRDREIFRAIHKFIYWLTKFWSTKVIKSSQHSKTVTKSCSKKFKKKKLVLKEIKKIPPASQSNQKAKTSDNCLTPESHAVFSYYITCQFYCPFRE